MKNILCLLLVGVLSGCAEKSMPPVTEKTMELMSDRSDSFRNTEGEITVKVLEIEDSRCPSDVICVWQGIAKVRFEITDENHAVKSEVFLPEYKDEKSSIEVMLGDQKLRVTLKQVTPYPCKSCTDQSESKAQLEVEMI